MTALLKFPTKTAVRIIVPSAVLTGLAAAYGSLLHWRRRYDREPRELNAELLFKLFNLMLFATALLVLVVTMVLFALRGDLTRGAVFAILFIAVSLYGLRLIQRAMK